MTATEKFNIIKRACVDQKVCQLLYKHERVPRFIHPLGVCLTFNRGLVIVCCVQDFNKAVENQHKAVSNLPLEDCHEIKMIEKTFQGWPDFVTKTLICDDWLFHIPV
jgi:hypothetical protein